MRKKITMRPKIMVVIAGLVPNNQARAFIRPNRNAMGCVAKAKRSVPIRPYFINFMHFAKTFGGMKRITNRLAFPFLASFVGWVEERNPTVL